MLTNRPALYRSSTGGAGCSLIDLLYIGPPRGGAGCSLIDLLYISPPRGGAGCSLIDLLYKGPPLGGAGCSVIDLHLYRSSTGWCWVLTNRPAL